MYCSALCVSPSKQTLSLVYTSRSTLYQHSFIPLEASVAIASLVLYIAFPVGWLRAVVCLPFLLVPLPSQNDIYYTFTCAFFLNLLSVLSCWRQKQVWNHREIVIETLCPTYKPMLTRVPDTLTPFWWASTIASTSGTTPSAESMATLGVMWILAHLFLPL
jgi:hypothetical protein